MNIFEGEELNLKSTLLNLTKFIGGDIIKSFKRSIQFTDEPRFYEYTAEVGDYSKYSDAPYEKDFGSGLSYDERKAKIKALAEAIERFSMSVYRKEDLIKESYNTLKSKAINPTLFLNFSKSQYQIPTDELKNNIKKYLFYWTTIYSIKENKTMLIPAQLIYVPFNLDVISLRHPISTGAAVGTSYTAAIYRGICEIIERDAYIINYLAKIPAPRINESSIKNKKIKELISYFKRYFLELHLFNITTDIKVPVILALIIDKTGVGPSLSVGAKCDLNIENAIIGAIEEAQKTRTWIRYLMIINNEKYEKLKNHPERIKSMEDRGLFWAHKELYKKYDFLINSNNRINVNKNKVPKLLNQKLKLTLNAVNNAGLSVYVKDISPESLISPFKVVKAVIPEAHPLFLYEDKKYLWSKRLFKVPVLLGYKKNENFKLNEFPHPFV